MPRKYRTNGYTAIEFIESKLLHPDGTGRPFTLYDEQKDFLVRWYRVDETARKPRYHYHRGCLMRPRGWGKSPFMAAIAAFELLGDAVLDTDSSGELIARPHRQPNIVVAAVTETQTQNTYRALCTLLRGSPAQDEYGLFIQKDSVIHPETGGIIETLTSSANAVKGIRSTFTICDQTEVWVPSNHGPDFFSTLLGNAQKSGTRILESPNAFVPQRNSVAEKTAEYYHTLKANKAKVTILYDHRAAPAEVDIYDDESLRNGVKHAYGDAADTAGGHVDVDVICEGILDPAKDIAESRSDFLNQIVSESNAYISVKDWGRAVRPLDIGEVKQIALGFDGSIGRVSGLADSTALVGVSLDTEVPVAFVLGLWEQPRDTRGWQPPREEITTAIHNAFTRFQVRAFFADPKGWEETLITIGNKYRSTLKVSASQGSPVIFSTSQTRLVASNLDEMHGQLIRKEFLHNGDERLGQHVMNASRSPSRFGFLITKAHPDRKIDLAYAMLLAFMARKKLLAENMMRSGKRSRPRYISLPG